MSLTSFAGHFGSGDHASRPDPTTKQPGYKYACSTHKLIYETDATTWSTWAELGDPGHDHDLEYDALGSASAAQSGAEATAAAALAAKKLDDLAAPDDNTDLNVSTSAHGLAPKLPGGTTTFLRGDGAYAAPPGGGSGYAPDPAAQPDGKIIETTSGAYVFVDKPTGGGGGDGVGGALYLYENHE